MFNRRVFQSIQFTGITLILALSVSPGVRAGDGVFVGLNNDTAIGSVLGGIIGYQIDKGDGAVVGSILGALAGSAVHRDRHRQYHSILKRESRLRQLQQQTLDRIRRDSMYLTLSTDQLFVGDTALLNPEQKAELDSLARKILAVGGASVVIDGHTDDIGDAYPNLIKSIARAQAIATQLVIRGVPRAHLAVNGYGETSPLNDNATTENPQLNRRIEISVQPLLTRRELLLTGG